MRPRHVEFSTPSRGVLVASTRCVIRGLRKVVAGRPRSGHRTSRSPRLEDGLPRCPSAIAAGRNQRCARIDRRLAIAPRLQRLGVWISVTPMALNAAVRTQSPAPRPRPPQDDDDPTHRAQHAASSARAMVSGDRSLLACAHPQFAKRGVFTFGSSPCVNRGVTRGPRSPRAVTARPVLVPCRCRASCSNAGNMLPFPSYREGISGSCFAVRAETVSRVADVNWIRCHPCFASGAQCMRVAGRLCVVPTERGRTPPEKRLAITSRLATGLKAVLRTRRPNCAEANAMNEAALACAVRPVT